MNAPVLIPLVATIAYIPLFVILLSSRPWNRKQKFFLLFLITAVLWSLSTFLSRSDLLIHNKLLEVKIVICVVFWMLVQFHYFVSSFYRSERIKIPLAYIFPIAIIVLAALGYIPQSVEVTASSIHVNYGFWVLAIALLLLLIVGVKDIVSLRQRHKISSDAAERNQIVYLFTAIGILAVFLFSSFLRLADEYAVSHIGNFVTACVLTYAVVTHRLVDVRVVFR
ncbi:MAG: hypothetical protein ACETVW_01035, partial [Dehalococcoidia bacterium]